MKRSTRCVNVTIRPIILSVRRLSSFVIRPLLQTVAIACMGAARVLPVSSSSSSRPPHVGLASRVYLIMSICPHCVAVVAVSAVSLPALGWFALDYLEAGWASFKAIAAQLSERI